VAVSVEDPPVQFRLSHATAIAVLKEQVSSLNSWAKVGVTAGIGLLGAILAVLLMR
jgi:ElaB/YqjD/DUF883 family membrane-anchored ribosome-binding protein